MKQVLFARFRDVEASHVALSRLQALGGERVRVQVHEGARDRAALLEKIQHSGMLSQMDFRHGSVLGVATGLAVGVSLGFIAFRDMFPGSPLLGPLLCGFLGLIVGLLMSFTVGAGLVDRQLQALVHRFRKGEVVMTVESNDAELDPQIDVIMTELGVATAHKQVA